MNERWTAISPEFHSLYLDGPFQNCIDCNRELLDGGCLYWIERIFRGSEPIFEMAICLECRDKITEELSKDSMMRINAYVEERFDPQMRLQTTMQWDASEPSKWLEQCVFTKLPRNECRDFQIAALCHGHSMSIDLMPLGFSGLAAEEIQKLMSKKTRDRLGQMIQDFFGSPSEYADGPESYSPVII